MGEAQELRIGDRIRFLRMPSIFSSANYYLHPDTLELYTHLVSTGDLLEIEDYTKDGFPLADYVDRRNPENPVFHGLVITNEDDGCWERAPELA